MTVSAYDFFGLVLLYPLESLLAFVLFSVLVRFLLGIFISLPEGAVPLWFQAIKSCMAFTLCLGVACLALDLTLFRADPKENPLAHISSRQVLDPCADKVILRKNEDGSFGVPLLAQYELRRCLNMQQGRLLIGDVLDSGDKSLTLAPWIANLADSVRFEKGEGFFPRPRFAQPAAKP